MRLEYHCLYWPNTNPDIVNSHMSVINHFGIDMNYTRLKINHGVWIDTVIEASKSDIIVIFDIDAVPINDNFMRTIKWVQKNKTFAGIAQVSNHIPPANHIYAAPAFYVIHKGFWDDVRGIGFREQRNCDVGEGISYFAEKNGVRYKALYPDLVYKPKWRLGNYGCYGIGTVFDNSIFHLYESRMNENVELFEDVCNRIITNTLDFSDYQDAVHTWI